MSQPIIGISGNHYKTGDHTEPLLSYTQTCLVNAIEDAGGIPLILPVTRPELAEQYMKLVDKLVLTGGQNVEPIHYQEKLLIDSSNYFPERDRFELALIEAAHHQEKPIFGICRGMQLYNVAQGGSLHQEVLGHWQENTGNQPIWVFNGILNYFTANERRKIGYLITSSISSKTAHFPLGRNSNFYYLQLNDLIRPVLAHRRTVLNFL